VAGSLRGRFGPAAFEAAVSLAAGEAKQVKLDPGTAPALRLENPRLWWPNGYGDPNLYPVELRFETADQRVSDVKSFQAGVRQLTYTEDHGALKIWINGRRFIARGGNWGFPESMLRYRARDYEAALRYHRDLHFNMIRDWVGQTDDDAFYEACDRNGVLVCRTSGWPTPGMDRTRTTTPCFSQTPGTLCCGFATIPRWASTAAATRASRPGRWTMD